MKQTINSNIKRMITIAAVPHPITDEYSSFTAYCLLQKATLSFQMICFLWFIISIVKIFLNLIIVYYYNDCFLSEHKKRYARIKPCIPLTVFDYVTESKFNKTIIHYHHRKA